MEFSKEYVEKLIREKEETHFLYASGKLMVYNDVYALTTCLHQKKEEYNVQNNHD